MTPIPVAQFKKLVQGKRKTMTNTNALTAAVVKYLNLKGLTAWRSNNIAAPGRRFTGMLGLPDVIGYHKKTGRFIAVEVKSKNDKLSLAQIEFAINALEGGCLWFEAREIKHFIYQLEEVEKNEVGFNRYQFRNLQELRNDLLTHTRKRKKKVA
jgi:hypothetical protein